MRLIDQRTDIAPINRQDCLRLLEEHELGVGRLTLIEHPEPAVVQADYAIVEDSIVFRTGPDTPFDIGNPSQHVNFEVESLDEQGEPEWAVVVRGRCESITPTHQLYRLRPTPLSPHSNAGNDVWVMIHPDTISGWRALSMVGASH